MKQFLIVISMAPFLMDAQIYIDASDQLPDIWTHKASMDVRATDVDNDGDLDVILANEFQPNVLLLNDGKANFHIKEKAFSSVSHDSEDIALADFNGDGIIGVSDFNQFRARFGKRLGFE